MWRNLELAGTTCDGARLGWVVACCGDAELLGWVALGRSADLNICNKPNSTNDMGR